MRTLRVTQARRHHAGMIDGFAPTFRLEGQRALVTGASRGIGKAIAQAVAAAGAGVVLAARGSPALTAAAQEIRATGGTVSCLDIDLRHRGRLPALVARAEEELHGPLDVVIHAAGAQARGPALEIEDASWDDVVAVNLGAPWRLSVEVARQQVRSGIGGSHVFVSSMLALTGRPDVSPYVASKTGLLGVIRALATEWGPHGIRVNGLAPGYVETELTRSLFASPGWKRDTVARIPLGRYGTPEDMAGPAVFLASRASAYLTGHLLTVDGGWTAS